MKRIAIGYPIALVAGSAVLIGLGDMTSLAAWIFGSGVGFGIGLATAYYTKQKDTEDAA